MENKTASQLFNEFIRFKERTEELLKKHAFFTEKYKDISGRTLERRPVVLVDEPRERHRWKQRIEEWESYIKQLHEIEPERFPLNSTLFNPVPVIIDGVTSCQIYQNNATTSRKVKGANLAKRTEHTLKAYMSKGDYDDIIKTLKSELEFWRAHENDEFRIRCEGYSDIQGLVSFPSRSPEKIRVNEAGVLLFPAKNWRGQVKVSQPEHKPQQRTKTTRNIYEDLRDIKTSLPIDGKIYMEKDVEEARRGKVVKTDNDKNQIDVRLRKKSGKSFLL